MVTVHEVLDATGNSDAGTGGYVVRERPKLLGAPHAVNDQRVVRLSLDPVDLSIAFGDKALILLVTLSRNGGDNFLLMFENIVSALLRIRRTRGGGFRIALSDDCSVVGSVQKFVVELFRRQGIRGPGNNGAT